jgi:hypothetical protein
MRRSVACGSARVSRSASRFVETYILVAMDAILLPPRDHCAARDQVLVRRAPSANSMRSLITFVFRFGTSVSCIQVREAGIELYTIVYTYMHIFAQLFS